MKPYIYLTLLLGALFTGCEKEHSNIINNHSYSITINFNPSSKTKSSSMEEKIVDVNLFIFDQNQKLIEHQYLNNTVSATLQIGSGIKTIAAITNVGNKDFSQCNTLSTLKSNTHNSILGTGGNTIFCGDTTVNITHNSGNINIPLTRMISKITYLFDKSNLNEDINIIIKKIELKNIPTECCYLTSNTPNISQITTNGYSLEGANIEPTDHNSATPLYLFENMQGTIGDNNNPITKHPGSKENLCTYVEITADYSSSTKTGTVIYKNYLGLNTTNNYDIVRDKHYKETIIFNGTSIDENSWRVDVSGLTNVPPQIINVTGIALENNSIKLINGQSQKLNATIFPANATNKNCTWSSSNPSIVSVNPITGELTTHRYGTATITVRSEDGEFEDTCTVNVYDPITLTVCKYEFPEYNSYTNQMTRCAVTLYLRANLSIPSNMTIVQAIAQNISVNVTYSYIENGITYVNTSTVTLDSNNNNDYPHINIGGENVVIYLLNSQTEEQLLAAINSISVEVSHGSTYAQNWYVTW